MANKPEFKFIQDILEEVSIDEGVDIEEVSRIWNHHEHTIGTFLRDPLAPNVIITGMLRLHPDIQLVIKEIFRHMHKCRITKEEVSRYWHRVEILRLLKIRTRLLKESKSYEHNRDLEKIKKLNE